MSGFLWDVIVRATVLFALGWVVVAMLRRRSAAARHLVWAAVLAGSLLLPALTGLLPDWRSAVVTEATPVWIQPAAVVAGTPAAYEPQAIAQAAGQAVPEEVPGPAPRRSAPVRWDFVAAGVWLAGSVLVLLRLGAGLWHVRWLRRGARPVAIPVAVPARVVVLESASEATMPVTWGWRRPRIVLPKGVAAWSEERLRLVMAHELAHIGRRDWAVQIMSELARALYWFHPLAWVAVAGLRAEGERACDDVVLGAGAKAPDYADHLVELARTLENPARGGVAALAVAQRSHFERRLKAMLQASLNRRPATWRAWVATAVVAGAALVPLAALAPGQEIRGVVTEPGTNHPVEGAEVRISKMPERVLGQPIRTTAVGTVTTNAQGAFQFEVQDFGEYVVIVQKEGFTGTTAMFQGAPSTQANVVLTEEHPSRDVQLLLGRAGEITGRIVDADTGAPVPNVRVSAASLTYNRGVRIPSPYGVTTTDREGRFHADGLAPGDYILQVQSYMSARDKFAKEISRAEIEKVEAGYAGGFYPGGPALNDALPMTVVSGTAVDVGAIPVHKTGYYRVHVRVPEQNCPAGAKVRLMPYTMNELGGTQSSGSSDIACGGEALLTNLAPGSYRVHARTVEVSPQERAQADAPVTITDRNLDLTMTLTLGYPLDGRVVLTQGAAELPLDKLQVMLRTIDGIPFGEDLQPANVDAEGRFHYVNRQPGRWQANVFGLSGGAYVKEVRYRGGVAPGNAFEFTGSGALEIEVDTQPGVVTGSVSDGGRAVASADVTVVAWPYTSTDLATTIRHASTDDEGKFQLPLPPGEYRVFALAQMDKGRPNEPGVMERLLGRAEKVTVVRGGSVSLALAVSDPGR